MSTQQNRINTIIALINSHSAFGTNVMNKLKREFGQAIAVDIVSPPQRRNLLKILHSTRALDTSLKTFLDHYNIRNGKHSIGQFLIQLETHTNAGIGNLTSSEKSKYQRTIANVRNDHLHNADSYPRNDSAVYQVISEMQALITRVTTL